MSVIRLLYGVKSDQNKDCDLVVALGYGLQKAPHTKEGWDLPNAGIRTIARAAEIAEQYQCPLAYASSSYFFQGSEKLESALKDKFVGNGSIRVIDAGGITNSVVEARKIQEAADPVLEMEIYLKIKIVCDWPHARSALYIWRDVYPFATITVENVEGEWSKDNYVTLQKSIWRWILACMLRHAALIILGLDRVAKIQHPLEN